MDVPLFQDVAGSASISVLISVVFAGCIAVQACSYFSRFQKDPLVLKCAIAVAWLGSLLESASSLWVIHNLVIVGYPLPVYDIIVPPGFPMAVVVKTITHSTVQGAYIFRMYRFGRNHYVLACSCILVLVEVGLGFTWAGCVASSNTMQRLGVREQEIEWVITSFFTISAFVDVSITVCMSYQLRQSRSNGLKRTKSLVDRIIRWTIATGMLTSSVAITIVFLWNFNGNTLTWAGMCTLLSECYAVGLLTLLNARRTLPDAVDSEPLSLSMAAMPGASRSETATSTTTHGLSAPQRKVKQIDGQAGLLWKSVLLA